MYNDSIHSENVSLPEGFKEFIKENALPIPPLSAQLFSSLEEVKKDCFASDNRELPFSSLPLNLSQLADFFARGRDYIPFNLYGLDSDKKEEMRNTFHPYCACALLGYGIQNKFFYYIEESKEYKCIIRMPWASAYGNMKEEENLNKALMLMQLVQLASLGAKHLELIIDNSQCEWRLIETIREEEKENVIEIQKSNSFKDLLELLGQDEIVDIKGYEFTHWLSV